MTDGSTQQRSRFLKSTDAGQHFDVHLHAFGSFHFIYKRSHTVDAGIAGADHADRLAAEGIPECFLGTLPLLLHAGIHAVGIRTEIRFDKTEIVFIADDYVGPADSR